MQINERVSDEYREHGELVIVLRTKDTIAVAMTTLYTYLQICTFMYFLKFLQPKSGTEGIYSSKKDVSVTKTEWFGNLMKYVLSEINVTLVTKIDRNEQYKAEIRGHEPMSARQAHQLVLTDVSRYTTNTKGDLNRRLIKETVAIPIHLTCLTTCPSDSLQTCNR